MEYTIDKLGKMAGVTSRTLRHYDDIGLLKPLRINASGYRVYGTGEVDRLQQILFFRALGVELAQIGAILDRPGADPLDLLRGHLQGLLAKRDALDRLISTVKKTIESKEDRSMMTDTEKFEGFKKGLINENEAKYGREVREKYGDAAVEDSNRRMMNLSEEAYGQMREITEDLAEMLERAVREGAPPEGGLGREIAEKHKAWLCFTWGSYSAEAHRGLVQMYVDDPRVRMYYDQNVEGCAAFLRDAVLACV